MSRSADPRIRLSARERLLAAAEALFYEEGFNTVGIDRVIERAGVAKASLYDCFGSKEELIRSYLLARKEARQTRLTEGLAKYGTPRERLLGVFDILGRQIAEPTFRGCAFMKARAEAPAGGSVRQVCEDSRQWLRDLFFGLAKAAGAVDPKELAQQLVMLYDGASISAQMDRNVKAAAAARAVAAAMLDRDTADPRARGAE
ncbi:MAG: TetR family transcriptional regulator [Gammaproteobacteria bacterium]|nr:TetR family transcriptional regulator [Gammaproteobacteria bacterium]